MSLLIDTHRDPCDRLLIAQARLEGLTLVTREAQIPKYDVDVLIAKAIPTTVPSAGREYHKAQPPHRGVSGGSAHVRKNFAAVVDAVIDDAEECVIPRGGGKAVVIVSLDEWNAVNETLAVLGSATNARRLLESIAQADAGLLEEHPLLDPDAAAPEPGKEAA